MLKGDDVAVLGKGLHVLVSVVEEGEGGQGGPRRQGYLTIFLATQHIRIQKSSYC